MNALSVYLEVGSTRTFAVSLDWPGWARSGRGEEAALEAFADYAGRYLRVARRTGFPVEFQAGSVDLEVVEQVAGTSTTDFGAPDVIRATDAEPIGPVEAQRLVACLEAAWAELDEVAASVSAALQKGPRGGGRDRDPMMEHVLGAEHAYARKIGVVQRRPAVGDDAAIQAMRADIVAVLGRPWDGESLGLGRGKSWPPRYAARRMAWHVLDHAWEMQDKDLTPRS